MTTEYQTMLAKELADKAVDNASKILKETQNPQLIMKALMGEGMQIFLKKSITADQIEKLSAQALSLLVLMKSSKES